MLKVYEHSKNYTCQVVEVKNLRKHSNADRLLCTSIHGNNIITGLDTTEGAYLYFPLECQLSEVFAVRNDLIRRKDADGKPAGGMFDPKRRVRAIKLRGEKSEGFIAELDTLLEAGVSHAAQYSLKVGDEFNEIDGIPICEKYVIPVQSRSTTGKQGKGGPRKKSRIIKEQFNYHYDTSHLAKNLHQFRPSDLIVITQKMHGTSHIMSNILCKKKLSFKDRFFKFFGANVVETEYSNIFASRRVIKNEGFSDKPAHWYKENIWETANEKYKDSLQKGITVYSEIVGQLSNGAWIQKGFAYGTGPGQWEMYVYRITSTNADGKVIEFSWQQVKNYCNTFGLKHVPELFYGQAADLVPESFAAQDFEFFFLDTLKVRYMEKMLPEGVPDEGICTRNESTDFVAYKLKSFTFLEWETKNLDKGETNIEDNQIEEECQTV